jgi:anaerobic ribonucleoside-triphosphate reductase activating protein
LWNKNVGREYTAEMLFEEIYSLGDFDGVTYIGGEPLEQGKDLVSLSKKLINANKDIVLFTGYELEELAEEKLEVCNLSSVVICGRYIEKERDTGLLLRGSRNQRIVVKDKNLLQFYNQEQRQVEVEIGEDYVKFLGFPEEFID